MDGKDVWQQMQDQWNTNKKELEEKQKTFDWQPWKELAQNYDVEDMKRQITLLIQQHGYTIQWDVPGQKFGANESWLKQDRFGFPLCAYTAQDFTSKLLQIAPEYWSTEFRATFHTLPAEKNNQIHEWYFFYYTMEPDDELRMQAAKKLQKPIGEINAEAWEKELDDFGRNVVCDIIKKDMSAKIPNLQWDPELMRVQKQIYWKLFDEDGIPTYVKTANQFVDAIHNTITKHNLSKDTPISVHFDYQRSLWHKEGEWVLNIGF